MSRKAVGIIALSFALFVLLVPAVPLSHSWPSNTPPPSAPMAFHGSLSWAVMQVGVTIGADGHLGFHECLAGSCAI